MKIHNTAINKLEVYEILKEFPFDSDRKRMTLIVKHGGQYILMCKGADSIMLPRFSSAYQDLMPKINDDLLTFAKEGLRTLVVCQKIINQQSYDLLDKKIYEI